MNEYIKKIEIRWADMDPNFHVLHSKYYDFGAHCRTCFITEHGITIPLLQQLHIGPILLREECQFKKEIKFGDAVTINLTLVKIAKNQIRWTMHHEIRKNDNVLAALITVDGAWLDTRLRKLAVPPDIFRETFDKMPKAPDFQIIG